MKKLILLLTFCLLLAACGNTGEPAAGTTTQPTPQTPVPEEQETHTTAATTVPIGPQPMDLVGSWKFVYTQIEGERVEDGNASLTIQGESPDALTVTYRDPDFPEEDFADKALSFETVPVFPGCGNEQWSMAVEHVGAIGNTQYTLTLLPDDTLMLQFSFTVEDMPMVSYRFFTRA